MFIRRSPPRGGEMVSSSVDRYCDINRKLLTTPGLWPDQRWRSQIIQVTLCLSLLVSFATVRIYRVHSLSEIAISISQFDNRDHRARCARFGVPGMHALKKTMKQSCFILFHMFYPRPIRNKSTRVRVNRNFRE